MKQTISILGCGWLGEPLAIDLLRQGHSTKGSTTSENKLQRLSSSGIVPFLIHLESLPSNISEFLNSEILIVALPTKNIFAFRNLMDQIEQSSVKKVLFISSTSVYSNSTKIVTEQAHLSYSPLAEIEQLFTENHQFQTTVLRFGGLFGYDRQPGNFFPKGRIIDNPNGFVNMIHRDDCIQIIEKIIAKDIWNETFNGCADTHPTRRAFYTKAALDLGHEVPTFNETVPGEYKIISNQKLKTMLEYEFKYPDLLNINEDQL